MQSVPGVKYAVFSRCMTCKICSLFQVYDVPLYDVHHMFVFVEYLYLCFMNFVHYSFRSNYYIIHFKLLVIYWWWILLNLAKFECPILIYLFSKLLWLWRHYMYFSYWKYAIQQINLFHVYISVQYDAVFSSSSYFRENRFNNNRYCL